MKGKATFRDPCTLWQGGKIFYAALINGERKTVPAVPGAWKQLQDEVTAGRKARQAANRKPTGKPCPADPCAS